MKIKFKNNLDTKHYSNPREKANSEIFTDEKGQTYKVWSAEKHYTINRRILIGIAVFAKTFFSLGLGPLLSKSIQNDWKSFWTGKKVVEFYKPFENMPIPQGLNKANKPQPVSIPLIQTPIFDPKSSAKSNKEEPQKENKENNKENLLTQPVSIPLVETPPLQALGSDPKPVAEQKQKETLKEQTSSPIPQPISSSTEKLSLNIPQFPSLGLFIVETEKEAKEQLAKLPVGSCKIWFNQKEDKFYCLQKLPKGLFNQTTISNKKETKIIEYIKLLNTRSKQLEILKNKKLIVNNFEELNKLNNQKFPQEYKIFFEDGSLWILDKNGEIHTFEIKPKENLFEKIENHFSEDGQFEAKWSGILVKDEKEAKEELTKNFIGDYRLFKEGEGFKFIQKISQNSFYETFFTDKDKLDKEFNQVLSFENQWAIYQQAQLVEGSKEQAINKLTSPDVPIGSYAFWKNEKQVWFSQKLPDKSISSFIFSKSLSKDTLTKLNSFNNNPFQQQLMVLEKIEKYFSYTNDQNNFYFHPDNQLDVRLDKLAVGDYVVWEELGNTSNFLDGFHCAQKMPGNKMNYTIIYKDENLFQKISESISRQGQWKALQLHSLVVENELQAEEQLKNDNIGSYKVWRKALKSIQTEEKTQNSLLEERQDILGEVDCLLKVDGGKFIKISIKETENLFSKINELMIKNKPKVKRIRKPNTKENNLFELNEVKQKFLTLQNEIFVFTNLSSKQIPQESFKDIKFSFLYAIYRKLSLIVHPDKNKSEGAKDKFQKLSAKWEEVQKIVEEITGKGFSTEVLKDIDKLI
jgi:hypothetical protein